MINRNTLKIIAMIVLMVYVISPVDAFPGPVDDMLLCLLYAYMNYMDTAGRTPENSELDDKSGAGRPLG